MEPTTTADHIRQNQRADLDLGVPPPRPLIPLKMHLAAGGDEEGFTRGTEIGHECWGPSGKIDLSGPYVVVLTGREADEASDFLQDSAAGLQEELHAADAPDEGLLAHAERAIDAAAAVMNEKVPDPEMGEDGHLSVREGAKAHDGRGGVVRKDAQTGDDIHARSAKMFLLFAIVFAILDLIGLTGSLAEWLHGDLFNPLANLSAWALSIVFGGMMVVASYQSAKKAGESANTLRDLDHTRQNTGKKAIEVAAARKQRNRWLALTVGVTAITAGVLVVRVLQAADTQDNSRNTVLVLLAGVAALCLPLFTYLYEAGDGTRLSRSLEPLANSLGDGADRQVQWLDAAASALAALRAMLDHIPFKVNEVLDETQRIVNGSVLVANLAILQSGLEAESFAEPAAVSHFRPVSTKGVVLWYYGTGQWELDPAIGCGLQNGRTVNTSPIRAVVERSERIGTKIFELEGALAAVPRHPWLHRQDEDNLD